MKEIEGFKDYFISDTGRVYSQKQLGHLYQLKHGTNKLGYQNVSLWKGVGAKSYAVHRLVAKAFIPNPENKRTVNHIDGDPSNNCVENLEWATYSENHLHAYRVLGRKHSATYMIGRFGKDHPNAKLIHQYTKDFEYVASFWGSREASRKTGIGRGNICGCFNSNPRRQFAGGYRWIKDEDLHLVR